MAFVIRAGRGQDWNAMREIFLDAGQAAWSHILPSGVLAGLSAPDRWDPSAGAEVIVADSAGTVVGFVCVRASADEDAEATVGEIDGLYVVPSMWGRGVGQKLLAAAVERLAASGFTEATLWTEYRNTRPLQFYRAAGWKLDGNERRRSYHGSELFELRHRSTLAIEAARL